MKTLKEIEARLAAIAQEVETDGADLDALEAEARSLKEARQTLLDAAEKRNKILAAVAGMTGTPAVETPKPETRNFEIMSREALIATPEYRSAFCKYLQKAEMSDLEQRAWTSATSSAGPAIPTEMADRIMAKAHQVAPLLTEIQMYHVPGNFTIAVEGTTSDPAEHTENATITVSDDTLAQVALGGWELNKKQQVSKTVAKMAMPAFENFVVTTMGEGLGRLIEKRIISGSGSAQATGVDKANTWGATNSVTVAKAASLTAQNVLDLIGLLPGGYDANAKFLMSKKTLIGDFLPLQDKSKNDLVVLQGGTYYVQGYPVMLSDNMPAHEAFLGDFSKYVGNMAEEINVTSAFDIDTNSYKFLGSCMFDGKPALSEAFVKLVKATS